MQKRVVVAFTLLVGTAFSQQAAPTFEVATIRASKVAGGVNNRRDPALASWTNTPLAVVIGEAYNIRHDQLMGGPLWIHSDRWDIIGKTNSPASREQQKRMLQPLLADRFHLKVRWEVRQLPEYELVVAPNGPKVRVSTGDGSVSIRRGLIDANGVSAGDFASYLRSELGRPVIDNTGLREKYDFKVQWVPEETQPNSGDEPPPSDPTGPTIFTAIRDLGLKLRPIKGPVQVLVIEHVEKPSEN